MSGTNVIGPNPIQTNVSSGLMDQLTEDQTGVMTQVNSTVSYVYEAMSHVTGPKPNPN